MGKEQKYKKIDMFLGGDVFKEYKDELTTALDEIWYFE